MKFHEWQTLWDMVRPEYPKGANMSEAYIAQMKADENDGERISLACSRAEILWYANSRPYYKAYPAVTDALCKLKLDCSYECPAAPMSVICVRFAANCEPTTNTKFRIGSLLISTSRMLTPAGERKGLFIMVQSNDLQSERQFCNSYAFAMSPETDGRTIEECILDSPTKGQLPGGDEETRQVQLLSMRIALTTLLLADDPSIITPDVLSKDADRYARETDEDWKRRAEERAKRRGKVGWNIGAEYEVCPHYRRPHFGIRHTGKGRTVPRIVPIKGAVVHRSKLTDVPTGYILPDGTEVENGLPLTPGKI